MTSVLQTVTEPDPPEERSRDETLESQYVRDLEQYRRRLEGAMAAGDLAWWEMDVETGAVEFDTNKADMLGRSPADFSHYEDFTELVHPNDYNQMMQAMRDHLEGRAEKYDTEYRIQTASGVYRWFRDTGGVTLRGDDGSPREVTGVVVDITQRKQAELQLEQKNQQLSLLNRLVRHDIRNDMNVVTGWLGVALDEVSSEQQANLERAKQAAEHTTKLTNDVRDLMTLLDSSEDELSCSPLELDKVLYEQIGRVEQSFDGVDIRTDGTLPSVAVRANAMLSSVIGNILTNAVHHADVESIVIDVEVEVRDETVVLSIGDNGPGIPEDKRDQIFEMDEKGDGSSGTGLGLFLVKMLVDAYGGSVWVEDNERRGTVFFVELQRADG